MTEKDGPAGVRAWIAGVKPEHRRIVERMDVLIEEVIPDVHRGIKWRKPSQPLGIPFYGTETQGWIVAMWSFKDRIGIGFIAGSELDPEPPVTKMAGPWNRAATKGRRIDIHNESEFDEPLIRSWLEQARDLLGWSKVD